MHRAAIAILLVALALTSCAQGAQQETEMTNVTWAVGDAQVTGMVRENGVAEFRGITYAKPPIGLRRWRAPEAVDARKGAIDATAFGPACPQGQGNPNWYRSVAEGFGADTSSIADLDDISEDCLTLNVWSNGAKSAEKPVMVWIHGGSNVNGYSHEPNYRGHNLAAQDVVVVSLNYRMGAFGFLPHPRLDREADEGVSGYYGLADLVLGLQWVQANISAFGGDPSNVTVFGESAGGGNISALLRMPSAKGLFHRAAIQSGALSPYDAIEYRTALAAGEALFATLGADTLAEMRSLSWEDVVERTPEALPEYYFGPVLDEKHLAGAEIANAVPLLIGANADEMLMYLDPEDSAPFESALASYSGDDTATRTRLSDHFGKSEGSELERANKLTSAAEFFCPALRLARQMVTAGAPVYFYYFTRARPRGGELGAYHGAEIPYVFDTADPWLPADDVDLELTKTMTGYWLDFARAGNPNGGERPAWAPMTGSETSVHELGNSVGSTRNHPANACPLLSPSS